MTRAFGRGSGQPPAGQPFGHLPLARVSSYSMGPSPYHNAEIGIKRQMSRAGCGVAWGILGGILRGYNTRLNTPLFGSTRRHFGATFAPKKGGIDGYLHPLNTPYMPHTYPIEEPCRLCRWLPRTASERSGHPESTPNARRRRAEYAPKARPLCGGYRRRCAVCRSRFDASAGRLMRLVFGGLKSDCRNSPQCAQSPLHIRHCGL